MRRGLARVARAAARRAPPRLVSDSRDRFGAATGTFDRDDGSKVELYSRYRDTVKEWRFYWWPVRVLTSLAQRVELPPNITSVLGDVMSARALPLPPGELALALGALSERFPKELAVTGTDASVGVPMVELVPREADIASLVSRYVATATALRDEARLHGADLAGARVLDVGTGSGRLAFALAGLGADEVVGVDLNPEGGVPSLEREPVRERLAGAGRVRLEVRDVAHLEAYPDGAFDLVCSMSAIEHFRDLPAALAELTRVLRPGGIMYHGVDPWFGRAGGHSLCTLDFPWGHARLTAGEFERYVAEQRPYECDEALDFYRSGFQVPRRTLDESRKAFREAGLEVIVWREVPLPVRDPHRRFASDALLADCRRIHAETTKRDLLTHSYRVVARRAHS